MSLQSTILSGSSRLELAASGGSSIKAAPPADDLDAVRRIQRALVALGIPLPLSFPDGSSAEPDGRFGNETAHAVITFQKRVFPVTPSEWDGRVGRKTLEKMDALLSKGTAPLPLPVVPPAIQFICGPDVTEQIAIVWTQIQNDFRSWTSTQKMRACNTILLPFKRPDDPFDSGIPTNLEELKLKIQQYSDIDGWDTLPLFQGASKWLRSPPVFDRKTSGPCATPSSTKPDADDFDAAHEDPNTCSNTVQVAGQCWLNGTVNYGTFGVMVRLCSDFASTDWTLKFNPTIRAIYSLTWAKTLIRAYKKFGQNPEGAVLPIAWTEATFNNGPRGVPSVSGNRPKCRCSCGCKGDVATWDYIWKPNKSGGRPTR